MVLEEDDDIKEYVQRAEDKLLERINEISRLMWGIEDIDDTWNKAQKELNDACIKKAEENGLDKTALATRFQEFNILDMVR